MSYKFEIYQLASLARQKLGHLASKTDHDLRCLVLHANLLDNLLLELSEDYEKSRAPDKESLAIYHANLHRSSEPVIQVKEMNEDADSGDDESSEDELAQDFPTTRYSPPMLSHDTDTDSESEYSDSESENEAMNDLAIDVELSSPTASISPHGATHLESIDKDDGLLLHRTHSNWNFNAA